MIHVLHISQADGGVAVYLQMLLSHLNTQKITNSLVCAQQFVESDFNPLVENFEQIEMVREISPKSDVKAIVKLRRSIRRHNPDIVYCHSSKAGALGRIAAFGLGKTVVYNAHGWAFNMKCSKLKRFVYLWVERLLAFFTDKIVCISNFEKESALRQGVGNDSKLRVIFNGIDISAIQSNIAHSKLTKSTLGIPDDAFVVGMIGRISEQKAPDSFVKMSRIIKDAIPQAFFMIIGDGPDRKEIESLLQTNGLRNSYYISGWISNPHEYMGLFDVGVLLSRWEGFGYAIVEYMAAKKPVVSTFVDAIPNIVTNEESGLLVAVDDFESAARQVIRLYENVHLRNVLVEHAYEKVTRQFTIERVALEHECMFEDLQRGEKLN